MKDELGHGSNPGTHAAGITALPTKQAVKNPGFNRNAMTEEVYHNVMPVSNYVSQVQDMLAMWDGTHVHSPLSADEMKHVNEDYQKRGSWRAVAEEIRQQRTGTR